MASKPTVEWNEDSIGAYIVIRSRDGKSRVTIDGDISLLRQFVLAMYGIEPEQGLLIEATKPDKTK